MAKKPQASGYVAASNVALQGVHFAQGEAVTGFSDADMKRFIRAGWVVAVGDAPADAAPEPDAAD